jgi:hypothetical protein
LLTHWARRAASRADDGDDHQKFDQGEAGTPANSRQEVHLKNLVVGNQLARLGSTKPVVNILVNGVEETNNSL